jgi:Amt family ammonium transporter
VLHPYPTYLNTGDNTWQLVSATLVGLMSIPGLAVLYGGLVQKRWAVNTLIMTFTAFSVVLVAWVLWTYDMGFGTPWHVGPGILNNMVGIPGQVVGHGMEQNKANIPLLSGAGLMPQFRFPLSSLVYFQFVFAAITPILFMGSVLSRMNLKAWIPFVLLWSTFVYSVNAFLIWGGGYWAQKGAVDWSGGYVIHLAAGTSGFVAAAVIGPRLQRDRTVAAPNNLMMVAIGAGLLWLGWNGFNGGDPYFAGASASTAVINTNLCTAAALLTWVLWDMYAGPQRKPTFLGAVNGMIVGLVAITPAAGFVDGTGALLMGVIASSIVWLAWNKLSKVRPFSKVDDAMGVVYTHGIAGLSGGLLVGFFANPSVIEYIGSGGTQSVSVRGLIYGHPWQVMLQFMTALTIIGWDAIVTFILLKIVGVFVPLRYTDEELQEGDVAIHDEEVYPDERVLERIGTRSPALASAEEGTAVRAAGGGAAATGPDVALPPTGMTASTDERTWEGGGR